MKRIALLLAVLILMSMSCAAPGGVDLPATSAPVSPPTQEGNPSSSSISLTNDYTPESGKEAGAQPESPGEFRLLTAYSNDGIVFERTGQIVLDQAAVPDLILGDDGLVHLYFQAAKVGNRANSMGMAVSPDFGLTWYFKKLSFADFPEDRPTPGDPDIVRLNDGTFRMYGTTHFDNQKLGIVRMDSPDGVNFGASSPALTLDENAIDSTTFELNGTWHMFTLDFTRPEQEHATSPDGSTFTLQSKIPFGEFILANGYSIDGGYRLIGFAPPGKGFRAFDTTNGTDWTQRTEEVLPFDPSSTLEDKQIKDPAILPLPDGRYLMVYVTKIP